MFCANCGREMAEDADFCGGCGHRLGAASPQPAAPVEPQVTVPAPPPTQAPPVGATGQPAKRGMSSWMIGCLVAAGVLVIVGLGLFLGRQYLGGEFMQKLLHPKSSVSTVPLSAEDQPAADVVLAFYEAWAAGDLQAAQALSTAEYAATLSAESFGEGYAQDAVSITQMSPVGEDEYRAVVEETFANTVGGVSVDRSTIHLVRDGSDWRVQSWAIVNISEETGE